MLRLTPLLLVFLALFSVIGATPSKRAIFEENATKLKELLRKHDATKKEIKFESRLDKISEGARDADRDDTPLMIAKLGYPSETHEVVTEDGYILQMHRIPFGKNSPLVEGVERPAVYLQHGLLCSSADYVMGIPEKSLGYVLADAGYDVWLGNYRGNTYSRKHQSLDPDSLFDNSFWLYSWDENGKYDIPAMIDYVLMKTGQEKLHYVGHSMGTTGFMVLMNARPEYADKVKMANLLAPIAYVEHMQSPLRLIAPFTDEIEFLFDLLGWGEFLPSSWWMDLLAELVCDSVFEPLCENFLFLIAGFDDAQMNATLLPTIISHTPAGASTKQIVHYGQEVDSGGFNMYDHGEEENMELYGQPEPLPWLVTEVNVPVSVYWGQNDWFSAEVDYTRMLDELPNIFDAYTVPWEQFNHLDFLWAIDLDTLLFPRVLENMNAAETAYQREKKAAK